MFLSELHPEVKVGEDGVNHLKFDLPCGHDGCIRVPINVMWGWKVEGQLPLLTIEQSFEVQCSRPPCRLHFHIRAGEIVHVK